MVQGKKNLDNIFSFFPKKGEKFLLIWITKLSVQIIITLSPQFIGNACTSFCFHLVFIFSYIFYQNVRHSVLFLSLLLYLDFLHRKDCFCSILRHKKGVSIKVTKTSIYHALQVGSAALYTSVVLCWVCSVPYKFAYSPHPGWLGQGSVQLWNSMFRSLANFPPLCHFHAKFSNYYAKPW